MKTALAGKIALCVCPPVLVATSVATVPPVRRTVHRLTAPHHPHPLVHHRHRPHRVAAAPCAAVPAGGGPGALRTFASPGPTDEAFAPGSGPLSSGSPTLLADVPETGDYRSPYAPDIGTPGGLLGPITGGSTLIPTNPTTPSTPTTPVDGNPTPAVPEPLTWILMLAGIGAAGSALRHRRGDSATPLGAATIGSEASAGVGAGAGRRRGRLLARLGRAGTVADLLVAPLEPLGATANGVATGAKSTKAALLAKAALCVCPPALLATSVAVVPPVRHAVYTATAPRTGPRALAAAVPCDPGIAIIDPAAHTGRVGGRAIEPAATRAGNVDATPTTVAAPTVAAPIAGAPTTAAPTAAAPRAVETADAAGAPTAATPNGG